MPVGYRALCLRLLANSSCHPRPSLTDLCFRLIAIISAQLLSLRTAITADMTLDATLFVCLSQLALAYSICTASFPVFQRFANKLVTQSCTVNVASHDTAGYWNTRGSTRACDWETSSQRVMLTSNGKTLDGTDACSKAEAFESRRCNDVPDYRGTGRPGRVSLSSNTMSDLVRDEYICGDRVRDAL